MISKTDGNCCSHGFYFPVEKHGRKVIKRTNKETEQGKGIGLLWGARGGGLQFAMKWSGQASGFTW